MLKVQTFPYSKIVTVAQIVERVIVVHALIDPIWKEKRGKRGSVYGWLKRITNSEKEIHVGETTKEDCLRLIELIKLNPYQQSLTSKEKSYE